MTRRVVPGIVLTSAHRHNMQNRMRRLVAGAGLRPVATQVYRRSLAGTCGVPHRSCTAPELIGGAVRAVWPDDLVAPGSGVWLFACST